MQSAVGVFQAHSVENSA